MKIDDRTAKINYYPQMIEDLKHSIKVLQSRFQELVQKIAVADVEAKKLEQELEAIDKTVKVKLKEKLDATDDFLGI